MNTHQTRREIEVLRRMAETELVLPRPCYSKGL